MSKAKKPATKSCTKSRTAGKAPVNKDNNKCCIIITGKKPPKESE